MTVIRKNSEFAGSCGVWGSVRMPTITNCHITSELAIRTLRKALESQCPTKNSLILHSDQGSKYTSKAFIEFCESAHVTQSMSKVGYPYDNAPMERYFNTFKNDAPICTNFGQRMNGTKLWRNSPMSPTTICARTVITATAHHIRLGQQHKQAS